MMLGWHIDAFSVFPVGRGWDIQVNEFDFRDNGGVVYEEDGVKVIHWQRSHAKDGASGYRLDWNGLCFVWTGDGRPSKLDAQYAKGCDVYVTEMQPELVEISSGVQGVPPFLGRYTIDTHHTPGYAAGYVANQVQPRLFMTTHMPFDPYLNEEAVAEIREHWHGPFHFGAPDGIVVNVTKESIWVREGIIPDYPNSWAPQFDLTNGQLIVPRPRSVTPAGLEALGIRRAPRTSGNPGPTRGSEARRHRKRARRGPEQPFRVGALLRRARRRGGRRAAQNPRRLTFRLVYGPQLGPPGGAPLSRVVRGRQTEVPAASLTALSPHVQRRRAMSACPTCGPANHMREAHGRPEQFRPPTEKPWLGDRALDRRDRAYWSAG